MSLKSVLFAAAAAMSVTSAALAAEGITLEDAYARSSGNAAKAGAAFMVIENKGDTPDRLIGVTSDAAARVELHTHEIDANGVARMVHVEEGFEIPAGEAVILQRGGNHVMFMGLNAPFEQGGTVPLTLVFERAGKVQIDIPVDQQRKGGGTHSH